jgi:kumamolisin
LSREEHAREYGADPDDIKKVETFAQQNGLKVVESSPSKRSVILTGTPAAYNRAFQVELKTYTYSGGTYRGREGDIHIPAELKGIITSVTGLDNRPFAKPHFRIRRKVAGARGGRPSASAIAHADSLPAGFTPVQISSLYNFPAGVDGTGQTIGIIELGGGFRQAELNTYFQQIGVNPPNISVADYPNGGTNSPGTNALDPNNPDLEVLLDIEVTGAVAPGAQIVIYFAPDATDQSFLNVVLAAVHDTTNQPSIISISWGGPEDSGTLQFVQEFDQVLQSAAQMGVTVCVAAGDNGSADFPLDDPNRPWDQRAHVDFPASSSFVLACGGTQLSTSNGSIAREVVWDDGQNDGTGGGVSRVFALPSYQNSAAVPDATNPPGAVMRGVPDVAGDAAPGTGYRVLCDGQAFPDPSQGLPPVGGTSAVAPLWAGLVARLNQALGKQVGFLNPLLYGMSTDSGAFNDITDGNNGDYSAGPGWDPCTGLGTPNGQKLLAELS